MAYGLLLYKQIETPVGTQRLEIHKDGYAGSAVEIVGLQRDGISISKDSDDLAQAITTSVLTIDLHDCEEVDYSQFFTPNSTLFKVIWKTKATGSNSWETRWTGFITPDSFKENLSYRDVLTLTARDNLGRLGDYDFSLAKGQMMSVRNIVNAGLTVAGAAMDVTYVTTKVATNPATILAVDGLVNTTLLQGMTWREAVNLLLTGLGLTLAWNDGNHFEVRDLSQAPSSSQAAFFINQSGYRQIRPAWKNLVIDQNYGLRDNFYEGQLSEADCGSSLTFTPPVSSRWATTGTMALLNPYKGAPYPLETLYIPIAGGDAITNSISYSAIAPSMQRPIKISMRCNNSVWIWRDPADYYGYTGLDCFGSLATRMRGSMYVIERVFLRFRFNIFMTVGSTKYVMRNGWEVYDPSTIAEPYLYFVMPASLNEYGEYVALDTDNDISFYINNVPGPGTLELAIYPVAAQTKEDGDPTEMALAFTPSDPNYHKVGYGRITDIKMEVDEGISARAKDVIVNADHNMKGQVSVEMGQVPQDRGNTLLYLGGLFYTDTYNTPMAAFARASGGSTYDLLELVGREYISYQNAAYNALSGSMMAETLLRFDKAISYGGKTYRIVGASLNILGNSLNAQLLQEEATFDTTAYTVNDVTTEGGNGSYKGSGGISQGNSASPNYFEEDGEGGIKLKDEYTGLWAAGFMSAGGMNPGGGGGGGGVDLNRVWESLTNNTDKPDVKINIAHIPQLEISNVNGLAEALAHAGGVHSVVGETGDVTVGQIQSALISNGAKLTDTVYSEGTGISISGAYAISINSSYRSKIDHGETAYGWGDHSQVGYLTSVPKAADGTIGGFQTGYTESGKKYAVKMSGNKAYVEVPWVSGIGSVLLASGTNNGTLKLTVDGSATDNIAVKGLGDLAFLSAVPAATDNAYGGFKTGYSESGRYYAVKLSSGKAYVNVPWTDTVYTHPTYTATTIAAGTGKVLSAITVDSLGHVSSVASKTLAAADIPDLSSSYLPLSGGVLTGDLYLRGGNYGRSIFFGDGSYVYLNEDTDDHLKIYANKGIELLTGNSYGITVDNNLTLDSSRSLTLGSGVLTWDSTHNAWKLTGNLYATGFISAGGVS